MDGATLSVDVLFIPPTAIQNGGQVQQVFLRRSGSVIGAAPMSPDPKRHSRILQHLIDTAPIQVWGVDRNLDLVYLRGAAVENAVDRPLEEFLGQPLETILTPDSLWVLDRHRAAFAGEAQSYEVRWQGRVLWVHLEPPDDEGDEVSGIAVDVTARARAHERLEHLFSALGQGVVYQAPTGEITAANAAAESILGLTLEQMTGRKSVDPEWQAVRDDGSPFPGEDHPAMVALRENRVVRGVIMGVNNPRQDHHRWIRVTAVPRPGPDGRPAEVFTSFEDITVLRDAEREIASREQRFRRLTEHASDGFLVLDADGAILESSSSMRNLLSLDGDRLAGRDFSDLLTDEYAVPFRAGLRAIREGRRHELGLEVEARGGNGPLTLYLWVSDAIEDPAVRGIVVNARDISEEQRLLSEVHQLQKMEALGRLASGVAHDFNNLLTSILGFAHLLEETDPAEASDAVQEIVHAGHRGRELTRQLLQFSRRDGREARIFDLGAAVLRLERMLRRLVAEDLDLRVQADKGAWVKADRGQLEQVIMNLVVNARDATPSGGAISLSVAIGRDDGTLLLRVSDTGSGIDDQHLPHIFEPFYTTKGPAKGTGLGLSTVLGIVEQNQGSIEVETILGAGTTFTVRLPLAPAPEAPTENAPPQARDPGDLQGRTVLVVDDDPAVRRLMVRTLRMAGLDVVGADNPDEAFELVADRDSLDVLISDVVLPGLRGPEFADRILETHPDVQVILISGYTENELEELDGRYRLLSKPFETEELIAAIRKALA